MKKVVLALALLASTPAMAGGKLLDCWADQDEVPRGLFTKKDQQFRFQLTFDQHSDRGDWTLFKGVNQQQKAQSSSATVTTTPTSITYFAKGVFENKVTVDRATLEFTFHRAMDLSDDIFPNYVYGSCKVVELNQRNQI